MALKTVNNLKDSIAGLLSGLDLNNVDNLNGAIERAVRTMLQKANVPEASGIQNITLYAGVYDYACDPRIFGQAINDIRPQGISRNASDFVIKTDQQDFDRTKRLYYPSGTMSTFQWNNGLPIIRIVAPFPKQQIIIDPMNAIGTSPNAWVASGTASNLTVDYTSFYQSPASLRSTVTGLGTGIYTKTLQNTLSMVNYQGVGLAFLAIQIPANASPTDLATMSLKLGSSSSNYDLVTVSTAFLGSWTVGEWLLVAFDFSSVSTVGTPNWSAINYVQVLAGTLNTLTNFRIGGLFMSLPSPAQILYQSAAIFKAANTAATTTITANTDSILLSDPAYTILEFESAYSVLQQTGAGASDDSSARINSTLHGVRSRNGAIIEYGLYDLYRADNPSQEIRTLGTWYDTGDTGYNAWSY